MNRSIGYVSFGLLSVAFGFFAIWQQDFISKQDLLMGKAATELRVVAKTLSIEKNVSHNLRLENEALHEQIASLDKEIVVLKDKIAIHESIIESLEGKLKRRVKKFQKLESQIKSLSKDKEKNAKLIAKKEAEKVKLLEKINELEKIQIENVEAKKNEVRKVETKEIEKSDKLSIESVLTQTWVNYHKVTLTKSRGTTGLSRIKKGSDKWKYTLFEFDLNNLVNKDLLFNEEFIVKIVNSDTGEILPFIEANPKFPKSPQSSTGASFRFKDNPIQVLHINTQQKEGKNYEARVYYLRDGKEYLLKNSIRPIITNEKPFSL